MRKTLLETSVVISGENVVVAFNFNSLGFLRDDLNVECTLAGNRGERLNVALCVSRFPDPLTPGFMPCLQPTVDDCQKRKNYRKLSSYLLLNQGQCSRRTYSSVRVVLSVTLPTGSPRDCADGGRSSSGGC